MPPLVLFHTPLGTDVGEPGSGKMTRGPAMPAVAHTLAVTFPAITDTSQAHTLAASWASAHVECSGNSYGGGMNGTVNASRTLWADSLPAASTAATLTVWVGPPGRRSVKLVVGLVAKSVAPS